jgi:hypothetical protein
VPPIGPPLQEVLPSKPTVCYFSFMADEKHPENKPETPRFPGRGGWRGGGRPKGSRTKKNVERDERIEAAKPHAFEGMSDHDISRMLPRDIFRRLAHFAARSGDMKLASDIAKMWAPYEHATRSENVHLTPEELRNAANLARSEAARRGYDVEDTPGPAAGALPH